MTRDPGGPSVERADCCDETLARTFATERSADGRRPSLRDFESLSWPFLKSALSDSWRSAVCVDEDYPEVWTVLVRTHHGMFPPARVVFVNPPRPPALRLLIVIGIDFDWDYEWPGVE